MNQHIDVLRTFTTVADAKGFTKAGKVVHRSQSAVSMQIKRLEEEVGRPLFERTGHMFFLIFVGSLAGNPLLPIHSHPVKH